MKKSDNKIKCKNWGDVKYTYEGESKSFVGCKHGLDDCLGCPLFEEKEEKSE